MPFLRNEFSKIEIRAKDLRLTLVGFLNLLAVKCSLKIPQTILISPIRQREG